MELWVKVVNHDKVEFLYCINMYDSFLVYVVSASLHL